MKVLDITRRRPLYEGILEDMVLPPGEVHGIGPEKEKRLTSNISVLTSPHGSYRFIYRMDGKIVSGLQVMSRDGKTGVIGNVYTSVDYQRRGMAKELLNAARKKFKRVDQAPEEHRTSLGKKFAAGTG